MSMARTLVRCMGTKQCCYDTVRRYTGADSAIIASIPRDRLARAILLEDQRGYLTAVIPSSHHLKLSELREQSGRMLSRARSDGVREVFRDCEPGALPPIGMAYHTLTWLDQSLLAHADVYFESGDCEEVVHMVTAQFDVLMTEARRGHFGHREM